MTSVSECAEMRGAKRVQSISRTDILIPRVTTAQLALIEKDLDGGRAQSLANLLRGFRIPGRGEALRNTTLLRVGLYA